MASPRLRGQHLQQLMVDQSEVRLDQRIFEAHVALEWGEPTVRELRTMHVRA